MPAPDAKMNSKRRLTMYCTPAMKTKLQALAKRSGCSMNCFIEACFRMAIQCFDGKTTDLIKMLERQDAKPTKERDSIRACGYLLKFMMA